MQTQHNVAGVSEHQYTHDDFTNRFARYEAAVRRVYQDHGSDGLKELESARQSLVDISRRAKAAFDAKHVTAEGDRLFGKILKDWATALMRTRKKTRAEARETILSHITALKNVEESKAFLLDGSPDEFIIDGAASGRISCSEPNFTELDHLPEGNY
jgi:hypothetical protein